MNSFRPHKDPKLCDFYVANRDSSLAKYETLQWKETPAPTDNVLNSLGHQDRTGWKLTCGLCVFRWQRRPCGSRGWWSWTSWCRWWHTPRSSHGTEWMSGQMADRPTGGLQRERHKDSLIVKSNCYDNCILMQIHCPYMVQIFFILLVDMPFNLLFLWMANMIGRSSGWRCRRTGVPIRSWGRYPRSGTALIRKNTS